MGRAVTAMGSPRLTEYQKRMKKRTEIMQSRSRREAEQYQRRLSPTTAANYQGTAHYKVLHPAKNISSPRIQRDPDDGGDVGGGADEREEGNVMMELQAGLTGKRVSRSGVGEGGGGGLEQGVAGALVTGGSTSKGYGGQLYRGALFNISVTLCKMVSGATTLALLIGRRRTKKETKVCYKNTVPVGFFGRRGRIGRIAGARSPRRDEEQESPVELMVGSSSSGSGGSSGGGSSGGGSSGGGSSGGGSSGSGGRER